MRSIRLTLRMGMIGLFSRKMGKLPCFILAMLVISCLFYISLPFSISSSSGGQFNLAARLGVKARNLAGKEGNGKSNSTLVTTKPPSNFPRPNEQIYHELPFQYVDHKQSYQTEGVSVRGHTAQEEEMLNAAKSVAALHLKAQSNKTRHPIYKFLSGRYRVLGGGIEHDLIFKDKAMGSHHRVTLYQQLEKPKVISATPLNQQTTVNVIIALQGRLDKYSTFLDHIIQRVLPRDPHFTLTVVYFNDTYSLSAVNITKSKFAPFPSFKWRFIFLDEKFSRGRGLDEGARRVEGLVKENDKLLFFCDVDVLMHPGFFSRCRSNTRPKLQVYYPMVFSLYNPSLVYPITDRSVPALWDQLRVDQNTGFWRKFGYGMACVYRGDYLTAGGYPDYKTWGGEDEELFKKFLAVETLKIIRSPEPELFHLYHHKDCSNLDDISYVACLKSKAVTEGSQIQLGLAMLKLQNGTDLEGILSKRFYYFWLIPILAVALFSSILTNVAQMMVIFDTKKTREKA